MVNVISWNLTLKYYQITYLCKVLLSIQPVASKKETSIWYKNTHICIRKEVKLCSLFFILYSLFFVLCMFIVLCFFFASWKGDKRTTVPSSFLKEEFVWWLNTPILVFIHQMKMCWFVDSRFFWRIKKIRKKTKIYKISLIYQL